MGGNLLVRVCMPVAYMHACIDVCMVSLSDNSVVVVRRNETIGGRDDYITNGGHAPRT